MDQYFTIDGPAQGEYKEKGSKFIGYVQRCSNEEEFKAFLSSVKQEHHKARHHCWASSMGIKNPTHRSNDDGEPSGSAGLPILNQLRSHQVHQIGAVVVRYFGGTKLGVSGLIRSYKEAAHQALTQANIIKQPVFARWRIDFDYSKMNEVMSLNQQAEIQLLSQSLTAEPHVIIGVSPSLQKDKIEIIKKILSGKSLDYDIDLELSGTGFNITPLELI